MSCPFKIYPHFGYGTYKSKPPNTWNVRSMSQGKLDVVKQEMVRISIDILGISEQKFKRVEKV